MAGRSTSAPVTGKNSVYRDEARLRALYGFTPSNTVNPDAEYCDQSDLYKVQRDAADRGAKYIITVWFDGMDWEATRAAAIARTGKVYTEGKGTGLLFQDYDAAGTAKYGYYATSPTHDKNTPNVDDQTVTIPAESTPGGYDARIAGPFPWGGGRLDAPRLPQGPERQRRGQERGGKGGRGAARLHRQLVVGGRVCLRCEELQQRRERRRGRPDGADPVPAAPGARLAGRHGGRAWPSTTPRPRRCTPTTSIGTIIRTSPARCSACRGSCRRPARARASRASTWCWARGYAAAPSDAARARTQGQNEALDQNLYIADADLKAINVDNGGDYVVAVRKPDAKGPEALADAAGRAARGRKRLFGFYGSGGGHLPYRTADGDYKPSPGLRGIRETYSKEDLDENPTLADMARAALTALGAEPASPFALFVEAGDVDFALHDNNLDNAVGAIYSGEDAVRVVFGWVEKYSNWDDAVVIVTADHGHYLVLDDPAALK